jgi:PAS domain S-box-containing protein
VLPFDEWPISRVVRRERFSGLRYKLVPSMQGGTRILSYSGTPVYQNEVHAYSLLTVHDVTEEELAAERLRSSERRLRAAMSALPLAVVIYGPDLRVQYVNDTGVSNLGMNADEVIGRGQEELGSPELVAQFLPILKEARDTRRPSRAVCHFNGREYEVSYVPLLDEHGKIEQILGLARDLTEENRTIRELKGFAYAVSHDLKSPARTVTGFSQILLEEFSPTLNEEAQDMLERIAKAGLRMSALLDDLLKLSRISVGQLHPEDIDLVVLARHALQDSGEHERIRFSSPSRIMVRGDRGLLALAIGNLIQNAVKYSRNVESPEIELGIGLEGGRNIYYVRDNGIGFDSESATNIFKPFFRFHDDKEITGTGIGLAIVDRVIDRHGGRVWAQSSPGSGACFYFSLPAIPRALEAKPA